MNQMKKDEFDFLRQKEMWRGFPETKPEKMDVKKEIWQTVVVVLTLVAFCSVVVLTFLYFL